MLDLAEIRSGRRKYLENTTGLFVNQARNTLDTTTTSETSDSWLCDSLDVVPKDLPVTLGTSLSKTFASLTSAGHVCGMEG